MTSLRTYFAIVGVFLLIRSSAREPVGEQGAERDPDLAVIESAEIYEEDGDTRLEIQGDEELQYNVFKLSEPERVLVDIIDAQVLEDHEIGSGGLIDRVEVQSIQDSLSSLVRFEVFLTSSANYLVSQSDSNLDIRLISASEEDGDEESMDMAETGEIPPMPEPEVDDFAFEGEGYQEEDDAFAVEDEEFSEEEEESFEEPQDEAVNEFAVEDELDNLEEQQEEDFSSTQESMSEEEAPDESPTSQEEDFAWDEGAPLEEEDFSMEEDFEEDAGDQMAPMPAPAAPEEQSSEEESQRVEAQETPQMETEDEGSEEEFDFPRIESQEIPGEGPAVGSLLGQLDTKVYTGRRISLEFQDARVQDVLRLIADVSQQNIVISDSVGGNITLDLTDVPWDQALDIILTSKGLDMVQQGNIIRVAPAEQLQQEREIAIASDKAAQQLEPLQMQLFNVNYAEASQMSGRLESLLSERGTIDTDERTNTLIVRDIRQNLSRIQNLVEVLDTQTPQVRIESRIVQANDQFARSMGIQWGPTLRLDGENGKQTDWQFPRDINVGTAGFAAPDAGQLSDFAVDALPGGESQGGSLGFRLGSVSDIFNLDLRLSYAESQNLMRVVSRPSVTVLDNRTANIIQGSRIPFITSSADGTNVEFQDAGIEISVTPQITADGSVILAVQTQSNEPGEAVGGQPSINIREAQTEMLIKSGRTAVLGGVFRTAETEAEGGVPFLKDIPVLGWLFKGRSRGTNRDEMLIFITPHILSDGRQAHTASSGESLLEP